MGEGGSLGEIARCDRLTRITSPYGGEVVPAELGEKMPPLDEPRAPCTVKLPEPAKPRQITVEEALSGRRSIRSYARRSLPLDVVSGVLKLAFGISAWSWWVYGVPEFPLRTFPSAGALQSVEVYPVVFDVEGVEPGVYRYSFTRDCLELLAPGNFDRKLERIALGQEHVASPPLSIVLTVNWYRTAWKYGRRGYKYALLDAGFAGENLYLAAQAYGLATCAVGAFLDEELCSLLGADCTREIPVLIMPLGEPAA